MATNLNTVKPVLGLPASMPLTALINALGLEGYALRYRITPVAPQSNFGHVTRKEARHG